MRKMMVLLALALLAWFYWPIPQIWPDSEEDVRAIDADYDDAVVKNVEVDPDRQAALAVTAAANTTKGFDRKGFNQSQVKAARGYSELLAGRLITKRVRNRLPLPSVEFYVRGTQIGWNSFDYDFGEGHRGFLTAFEGDAFWIRAVGQICSDSTCSERTEPDGIAIDPAGEHKYKVRLNENLPYRSFLIRFCADSTEASCGQERYAGSEALVCADQDLGRIEARPNEFVGVRQKNVDGTWADVLPDLTFGVTRKGGYSFSISEDGAAAACVARRDNRTLVASRPLAANIIQ